MKKKILSLLLSASMVCGMTSGIGNAEIVHANVNQQSVNKAVKEKLGSNKLNSLSNGISNSKKKADKKYVEGDVIVVYKKSQKINSLKNAKKYSKSLGSDFTVKGGYDFSDKTLNKNGLKNISKSAENGFYVQKIHSDKLSTQELISKLNKDKNVLYAEPNYKVQIESITDDTYSDFQWTLDNKKQNNGTEDTDINPESVWNKADKSEKEAVIAIVDTGVDYNHEDLKDSIWNNPYKSSQLAGDHGYDFINMDDDPMDDNGHGTHCTGIMVARANNKKGIAGVCQKNNVKIMPLKFLSESGAGDVFGSVGAYYYLLKAKKLGTNVVAVNNSWGGGLESRLFAEVLGVANSEGIISVIAAGNESTNMDKTDSYPGSDYGDNNIVVGASTENDGMASFSNYGAESVDIAAPGTDILSSVSYDCLNPSIYTDEQKEKLLSSYYDGEKFSSDTIKSITVKVQDLSGVKDEDLENVKSADEDKNAKDVTDKVKKISSDRYFGNSGKSTMFDFSGAKKGERYTISIPYKTGMSKTDIYASYMLYVGGPDGYNKSVSTDGNNSKIEVENTMTISNVLEKYNAANNTTYYDENSEDSLASMRGMAPSDNMWTHMQQVLVSANDIKSGVVGGKLTFTIDISNSNKCCFYMDDFAISKENTDSSEFGKYDFYSGTSMATPTVTGAIGQLYSDGDSPKEIFSKLYSCVRKNNSWKNKCKTGGVLDLSKLDSYEPVIRKIDVSSDSKIVLKGYNFGKDKGTIALNGTNLADNKIVSWDDTCVKIDAKEYIYKTVEVSLTNSKKGTASSVYSIVNTAKKLDKVADASTTYDGSMPYMATDGTNVYMMQFGSICKYDIATGVVTPLTTLTADLLADKLNQYELSNCELQCSSSLYYDNKALWVSGYVDGTYHNMYVLVKYDINKGTTSIITEPEELDEDLSGKSMAVYNGKVYFMGGIEDLNLDRFTLETKLSDTVISYDIKTGKWGKAASLPVKAAAGQTVVNGGKLFYYPALTEKSEEAKLYSFDGSSWSVASEEIKSDAQSTLTALNNAIGVCKDKLVFVSNGQEGYGKVFNYNIKTGKLEATGYDTGLGKSASVISSVTIGDICYFLVLDIGDAVVSDDMIGIYRIYSMPVKGISKPVVKVNKITVKASADKVYYGKKLTIKATVSPKTATNKAVTWSVNNKKYASISSKGVLTPKKAGIGKTVTVKAVAKDGSKVSGSIKIKILKAKK